MKNGVSLDCINFPGLGSLRPRYCHFNANGIKWEIRSVRNAPYRFVNTPFSISLTCGGYQQLRVLNSGCRAVHRGKILTKPRINTPTFLSNIFHRSFKMSSNPNQSEEVENEAGIQPDTEENNDPSNVETGEVKSLSIEKAHNSASNNESIVLRDLESLLQNSLDNRVSLIDYEASALLPVGENYGSCILNLVANVKITDDSPEEKLHLVAKTIPGTEFHKFHLKTSLIFRNEIFVYEHLAPAYKEIEAESVDGENLVELFPKFYGGRLTRSDKEPDKADEDAVILLENLKMNGYENVNRKEGLDLEHAKLAISELARFHGLGRALQFHDPDLFAKAKSMTEFPFDFSEEEGLGMIEGTIKVLCMDPRIADHEERIRESLKKVDWKAALAAEATEPWVSVIHGDFWVNNIMFKHGEDDPSKIEDMKFVDFQLARVFNPVNDLPYFLCTSTTSEVLRDHLDELLDIYYERFVDTLRKTGCDESPFTRKSFDEELDKWAKSDYLRCVMAIKFFTLDVTGENADLTKDVMSSVLMAEGSKLYFDRVWDITSKYLEKGWL